MLRLAMTALLLSLLTGCPNPQPAPAAPSVTLPVMGQPEQGGLSAAARMPSAAPMGALEVHYVLSWSASPRFAYDSTHNMLQVSNVWLLNPTEPIVVRFWDSTAQLVGEEGHWITFPSDFRHRRAPSHETKIFILPPSTAASLSIGLGASGLETERIPISGR